MFIAMMIAMMIPQNDPSRDTNGLIANRTADRKNGQT